MSPYSRMSEKCFQKDVLIESDNKFQNYVPDHTASQVQFYSSPRAHGYSLPVFLVSSPGGEATQSKILKRGKENTHQKQMQENAMLTVLIVD